MPADTTENVLDDAPFYHLKIGHDPDLFYSSLPWTSRHSAVFCDTDSCVKSNIVHKWHIVCNGGVQEWWEE